MQNMWLFTDTNNNGKFIACEYGNGLVKLSQPVSDKSKRCSAKAVKAKTIKVSALNLFAPTAKPLTPYFILTWQERYKNAFA